MTDFPTLWYSLTSEILSFHIIAAWRTYEGEPFLVGHYREYLTSGDWWLHNLSFNWKGDMIYQMFSRNIRSRRHRNSQLMLIVSVLNTLLTCLWKLEIAVPPATLLRPSPVLAVVVVVKFFSLHLLLLLLLLLLLIELLLLIKLLSLADGKKQVFVQNIP